MLQFPIGGTPPDRMFPGRPPNLPLRPGLKERSPLFPSAQFPAIRPEPIRAPHERIRPGNRLTRILDARRKPAECCGTLEPAELAPLPEPLRRSESRAGLGCRARI